MFSSLLYGLLLVAIGSLFASVSSNVRLARKSKLPIVLSPIDAVNPFWVLAQPLLLPLINSLPWGLGRWTRYNHRGWLFHDKFGMHVELGDAWMHLTPFTRTLYLADTAACQEVYKRKDDFQKPTHLFRKHDKLKPQSFTSN